MPSSDSSHPVVYIAGDVHLLGAEGPFMAWLDWLATQPTARLIILGDLFEYWIDTNEAAHRYREVFMRLRQLRINGWRVDVVRGNREMVAGRRLDAELGQAMHWPSLDLQLGQRRIRVVHGDRLCGETGSRFMTAMLRGFWLRVCQLSNPEWIQDWVARSIRRGSVAKQRRNNLYRHPHIDARWLFAAARGVDTVIAGHIHEQRRRHLSCGEFILVGDWPPSGGHWVEGYADGRIALCQGQPDNNFSTVMRQQSPR